MAGTADNFVTTDVAIGPGKMYVKLAIPAANGRLILSSDGTPDATQNPLAEHIGMTEGGTEWSVKSTFQPFSADEFPEPIITRVTAEELMVSGSMLQILDMSLAEVFIPTATRNDAVGTQGVTFGGGSDITYTSVAVIWPIEASSGPVVYGVFHLYRAYNDAGLAAQITSKKLSASPFAFRGLGIPTRPENDRAGRFFRQLAGAAS